MMSRDAIVLACANPVPEIWPWEASEAGARIVATGRSDFPNQVNNSLCFPFIFRGALDVGATTINEAMKLATVYAIANLAREEQFEVVIQVNGRLRGRLLVEDGLSEQELTDRALADPHVAAFLTGKRVVKRIVVPNKLVNFVL